ncbi:hypothetical protein XELAEV_18017275mg [Xenopus laevis]|uniref:Secreted protein n=1 Tax=Xenopus laevis TaxID=8355 RepID=A0A974DC62_XENLA|nr:hypothetical protein XELAEV_18017275mg [Xenopus laevis]
MKLVVPFLLVIISCHFDNSGATVQQSCLDQLFQKDAPEFVQQLGNLLCNYQLAKKAQNQELFIVFLKGVNSILGNVGCTVDDLLGVKMVPTLENAEEVADKVAIILFNFLDSILATVSDVLNDLPSILSDIVDALLPEVAAALKILEHINNIKDVTCDVLEDLLPIVVDVLKLGGDILTDIYKMSQHDYLLNK